LTAIKKKGDLLSQKSFEKDLIRNGVWGASFDTWLPLMINPGHTKKNQIIKLLKSKIDHAAGITEEPDIQYYLLVLSRLMDMYVIPFVYFGEAKKEKN
jgi:hypothetical protein